MDGQPWISTTVINGSKFNTCFRLMSDSEKKQYEDFNENLAGLNNKFLEKDHVLITKQRQVLPYLVKKNLQPKLVQPDWIYHQQFKTINYNPKSKVGFRDWIRNFFCGVHLI